MKHRIARLALAGGIALVALAPAAQANAAVCHPTFRPTCDAICARTPGICRLFG